MIQEVQHFFLTILILAQVVPKLDMNSYSASQITWEKAFTSKSVPTK